MRLVSCSVLALCAACLLPFAISCGSDDSEGTAGSGGAAGSTSKGGSGGGAAGTTGLQCDSTAALDLTGTWAAFFQFSIGLKKQEGGAITMCPDPQVSSSTMLMLIELQQDGTAVTAKPVSCTLTLPEVSGMVGDCDSTSDTMVTVSILPPQQLTDSMSEIVMPQASGALSALAAGSTLTMADRFLFRTGSTKEGDAMPQWLKGNPGCGASSVSVGRNGECLADCVDDCSATVDADHDSKVGVTFDACGLTKDDVSQKVKCNPEDPASAGTTIQGRVFLNFQTDPLITGKAKSSCEVAGTFDATTIYHVLGGDLYLSNTQISVASALLSLPIYEISPTDSKFRMIRVDGKHGAPNWKVDMAQPGSSCATAIQHQNEMQ